MALRTREQLGHAISAPEEALPHALGDRVCRCSSPQESDVLILESIPRLKRYSPHWTSFTIAKWLQRINLHFRRPPPPPAHWSGDGIQEQIPTWCGEAPTSASKDAVVTHETTLHFSDQPDPSMPDQLIVDNGDAGSNQLLKTRLLEIVSQLIFTLQFAKGSTVVCQDVHPDLIAFVRTRLFEICRAKVGLLADEIYVSSF
jgi:hypothetical protein